MIYIITGVAGFIVIHVFDIVALKKIRFLKPALFFTGSVLLVYALVMLSTQTNTLSFPAWVSVPGWVLLSLAFILFMYSLFINLPFKKTYVDSGFSDKLIKNKLYMLVRHPGVMFFSLVLIGLVLISRSYLLLIATPFYIMLDVILVIIQDRYFFAKMFSDYSSYRKETPMLLPNRQSIAAFINSIKQV
jgi:protein-S-isoprenylcysteine O-methyltransferase Ste14